MIEKTEAPKVRAEEPEEKASRLLAGAVLRLSMLPGDEKDMMIDPLLICLKDIDRPTWEEICTALKNEPQGIATPAPDKGQELDYWCGIALRMSELPVLYTNEQTSAVLGWSIAKVSGLDIQRASELKGMLGIHT